MNKVDIYKIIPSIKYIKEIGLDSWKLNQLKSIIIEKPSCDYIVLNQMRTFLQEIKRFFKVCDIDIKVESKDSSTLKHGDMFISLVKDSDISNQGYEMDICGILKIKASTDIGIYYATRTLLIMLLNNQELNYCKIKDEPMLKERALMLDMGRKFYSKEWIFKLLDMMSFLKLNTLQLHFSEDLGFRIESTRYPEIVSDKYLKKQEVLEIINYARERKIEIIPDIDTPGHLKKVLSNFPEFKLERVLDGKTIIDNNALDITNLEAVQFIKNIYEEYMELFKDSRYFHIGADEFIDFDKVYEYPTLVTYSREKYGEEATGLEIYIEYVNNISSFMKKRGFIARAWNDGFFRKNREYVVELTKDLEITYWTRWNANMAAIEVFINKGYRVINYNDNYFYYVLGENNGYTCPTAKKIYETWVVNKFPQNQILDLSLMDNVIGTSMAIWSDKPEEETQEEIIKRLFEPLCAMAEKTWALNGDGNLNDFISSMKIIKDITFSKV